MTSTATTPPSALSTPPKLRRACYGDVVAIDGKKPPTGLGSAPPSLPPSLPLWRAAQVVAADDALVEQFEATQTAEHGRATGKAAGDTFADAYDRSLHKSRDALTRAVPLMNALAEVAGDDGVLNGDEWKKLGPKFGALALQIAEKSKSAKPLSGDRTTSLMAGLSPAARQAMAKTTQSVVGLDQMPVLARLADQAATTKPLANHRLFAVQHLFASTVGLFDALEIAGVQAHGSVVFGKSYSTNGEVQQTLADRGFEVYGDYAVKQAVVDDKGMIVGLEAPLLSSLRRALEDAARQTPPQKLLLLDEGGKLNKLLHDVLPQYAHLCTIVEQTTNGLQNMAGTTLRAPAVSVASSQLKREVEGPVIGEDVCTSTLQMLDDLDPRLAKGKTIGVVGSGAIGIATAEAFARRGFQVVVTDIDGAAPARLAGRQTSWPNGGAIAFAPRNEVLGAGIVVGCTGTGAMSLDEAKLLKDGAILVSAASGDHEFPVVHTAAAKLQGASRDHLAMKDWQTTFDRASAALADRKRPGPIVTVEGDASGIRSGEPRGPYNALYTAFPVAVGVDVDVPFTGTQLGNFVLQQDERRFMVLRGGTPVNLGRDLPPSVIQLTRSMLFAACVQAVGEAGTGWKTFSPSTQQAIETHWKQEQRA